MKILVLSDSHGYLENARNVIKKIGDKMSCVIHLGDHDEDAERLKFEFAHLPFYYIRGNNDFSDVPTEKMLIVNEKRILITHGHKQRVYFGYDNLIYWGESLDADMVLFGHTHSPVIDESGKVIIFNPGSISMPRATPKPTFGIIDISDEGIIRGSIMEYHGKDSFMRMRKF